MGVYKLCSMHAHMRASDLRGNDFRKLPAQLELMTSLTSLIMSLQRDSARFHIRRDLGPIIRLPKLQILSLMHGLDIKEIPAYRVWDARSLCILGLARYELAESKSQLHLQFRGQACMRSCGVIRKGQSSRWIVVLAE